jgi:hypothetical protein
VSRLPRRINSPELVFTGFQVADLVRDWSQVQILPPTSTSPKVLKTRIFLQTLSIWERVEYTSAYTGMPCGLERRVFYRHWIIKDDHHAVTSRDLKLESRFMRPLSAPALRS